MYIIQIRLYHVIVHKHHIMALKESKTTYIHRHSIVSPLTQVHADTNALKQYDAHHALFLTVLHRHLHLELLFDCWLRQSYQLHGNPDY